MRRIRARLDENLSLRRQSLLIALLCAIVDVSIFALIDVTGRPWSPWLGVAGTMILLVDLALALPAATAGRVAVAHGAVRCGIGVLLLSATGVADNSLGNATGLVLAAYRAGAWLRGWQSYGALAALMLGMTANQALPQLRDIHWSGSWDSIGSAVLTTVANTFLPWLMGRYTTARSGYIDEVERQAEAGRQAAREALTQVVAEERGAIARDLHDTISHHVSAMGVHAAAARLGLAAGSGPDRVQTALGQVEASSLAAMSDLRRMLDLLHDHRRDGVQQPGLRNLEELLSGSRRAGLAVEVRLTGLDPARLPDSVDVAAYRVSQEILTNALRHGDGRLDLRIDQDASALVVTGRNPIGPAPRIPPGTGRGLDGLRQRAALFSGTLDCGRLPDGPDGPDGPVWRTRVSFPLEGDR